MKIINYILFIAAVYVIFNYENCKIIQFKEKTQLSILKFYIEKFGAYDRETLRNLNKFYKLRNYRIYACSVLGDGSNKELFKD